MARTKKTWISVVAVIVIATGGGLWWTLRPGTLGESETISIGAFNIYEFGGMHDD